MSNNKPVQSFDNYVQMSRIEQEPKGLIKAIKDIFLLTTINLKEIRLTGFFSVILTVFLPVGIVIFMSFAQPNLPNDVKMRFVIGNVLVSILQTCVSSLGSRIAQLKWYGGAEYYFVLPISRISIMYGILLNYLVLTLPGTFAVLAAGAIFYKVSYSFHPALILLFVEMVLALSGIGFLIGMKSKHTGQATALAQGASFFLIFGTPVYYSLYAVPRLYRYFVQLMPTTYASRSFTLIMQNMMGPTVWKDVLILGIFCIISVVIIGQATKWTEA